jgi:hypothetical protein
VGHAVRDDCGMVVGVDEPSEQAGDVGSDAASRGDDRAAEGLAHLQAAARELIQAARAVLDVAEELVDDPASAGAIADAMGAVVRTAARAGRRAAGHGTGGDDDDGPGRSGVERIRVG